MGQGYVFAKMLRPHSDPIRHEAVQQRGSMPLLKRITASPAFLSAAGSVAARYLRLVWHTNRKIIEPATIYDTVQMPAIIAMWHGQHFLAPFIKRAEAKASRQGSDLASPRRRTQRARRREARHRHHSRLRRAQRRIHRKGGAAAFTVMLDALADDSQCRADRRRAEKFPARCRHGHRQAGATFGPADLCCRHGKAAGALNSRTGTAPPSTLPFGRIRDGGEARRSMCRATPTLAALEAARQKVESELNRIMARALCPRRPQWRQRIVSAQAHLVLRTYRLLWSVAAPLSPLLLARRLERGKENGARLDERRGGGTSMRPSGALVWLHAASVGELASAPVPLIERIAQRDVNVAGDDGHRHLKRTGGAAAAAQASRINSIPLDAPRFVRRFLDRWQPDPALFVESDLWPNMMIETSQRGVPMILINGRLSENSFRRWRYLPKTIGNLLRRFDLCLAGTPADAMRLTELGAPRVLTSGNLKLDVPPPPANAAKLRELGDAIGDRPDDRRDLHPSRRG